ncbi:hypothetical protein ACIPQA_13480 [Streptomyces sp. NPDC090109]|uniref:hypothetical protein n=1 Tax=unclassified Streptomyces TaxID=2593676 RepID=UPI0036E4B303
MPARRSCRLAEAAKAARTKAVAPAGPVRHGERAATATRWAPTAPTGIAMP